MYYGITQDPTTKDFMLIMKYYESGSLRHYMTENFYNLGWTDKLDILCHIIKGLDHIHSSNFIHRDLHSGNILYSNTNSEHPVVISDLGISKPSIESTDNNEVYGIVSYMDPEILRGNKYTTASDIYSFGMIMWELMTGRVPFWDQDDDMKLSIEICNGLRPPIVTNAPDGYIGLMQECWHADPNKRPTSDYLKNELSSIYNIEWDNVTEFNMPTKIVESSDIGPVGAIHKSRSLSSSVIKSVPIRSLRNRSTTSELCIIDYIPPDHH